MSIKNAERTICGEVVGVQLSHVSSTQLVKQWRKFLSEVKNKTNLIKFISREWRREDCMRSLKGKTLFLTAESECWKVTEKGSKGSVQRTGREIFNALIGLHSFTGCDSVSTFAGKGKIGALKILISNEEARRAFRELGQSWTVSEDLCTLLEKFTCSLYIPVGNTTSHLNDARYELFCAKNSEL